MNRSGCCFGLHRVEIELFGHGFPHGAGAGLLSCGDSGTVAEYLPIGALLVELLEHRWQVVCRCLVEVMLLGCVCVTVLGHGVFEHSHQQLIVVGPFPLHRFDSIAV